MTKGKIYSLVNKHNEIAPYPEYTNLSKEKMEKEIRELWRMQFNDPFLNSGEIQEWEWGEKQNIDFVADEMDMMIVEAEVK